MVSRMEPEMHPLEAERMEADHRAWEAWESAHQDQLAREQFAQWQADRIADGETDPAALSEDAWVDDLVSAGEAAAEANIN